jgi:hypothetical protein
LHPNIQGKINTKENIVLRKANKLRFGPPAASVAPARGSATRVAFAGGKVATWRPHLENTGNLFIKKHQERRKKKNFKKTGCIIHRM